MGSFTVLHLLLYTNNIRLCKDMIRYLLLLTVSQTVQSTVIPRLTSDPANEFFG